MADYKNFIVKDGLDVGVGASIIATSASKNIGIGTTNPIAKLDVKGDASVVGLNVSGVTTFFRSVGPAIELTRDVSGPATSGFLFTIPNTAGSSVALNIARKYNGTGTALISLSDQGVLSPQTNKQVDFGTSSNRWRTAYAQDGNFEQLNISGVSTFSSGLSFLIPDSSVYGKILGVGRTAHVYQTGGSSDWELYGRGGKFTFGRGTTPGQGVGLYEERLVIDNNNGITLYHGDTSSSSIKLETTWDGINVTGIASASQLSYSEFIAAKHNSGTVIFIVSVQSKTGNHRYSGQGSSSGYYIRKSAETGFESPFLYLQPGRTYRFDQSHSSNSTHPLRFYTTADKTTQYTTNVTTAGTAGSSGAYTEITITDTTPAVLHYQCSAHDYMGNAVFTSSNVSSGGGGGGSGISSIFEDTTPKLGGDLDTNGNNIIVRTLDGSNNNVLNIGSSAGDRMQIYKLPAAQGGHTVFSEEDASGSFIIKANQIIFNNQAGTEVKAQYIDDGSCILYYDNTRRIRTTGAGVSITGGVTATGLSTFSDRVIIDRSTTNSALDVKFGGSLKGSLTPQSSALKVSANGSNDLHLQSNDSGGTNGDVVITSGGVSGSYFGSTGKMAVFTGAGSAELYHQDTKKLETVGTGVTVAGDIYFSGDLYQNGSIFSGGGGGGTQGIQGIDGAQGAQGITGSGTQGTQGITGLQGTYGTQGVQGITGAGVQGAQGTLGIQGDTGGAQGVQGIQGASGAGGGGGVSEAIAIAYAVAL